MSASRQTNVPSLHYSPVKCSSLQPLITATLLFEDNVSTSASFGMQNEDLKVPDTHVMFIYLNTDITKVMLPSSVKYLTRSSLVICPHLFSSKTFKEKRVKLVGLIILNQESATSFQQLGTGVFVYRPQMHVEEHLLE